jgi:ergothioneine biosynthesis protein EgtB
MVSSPGLYSSLGPSQAQGLRHGAAAQVRAALLAAREATLALADDYERALAAHDMRIAYDPGLNPPVWEWGHVAWFQEWWIARNRQRPLGVRCDPDHGRSPSLLPQADALYDSSRVAHRTRWELDLPSVAGTRAFMARVLEQTLEALDALPAGAGDDELYFFRLVALHECMHAEAAAYMARTLGIDVREAAQPLVEDGEEIEVPGGVIDLGSPEPGFAFDNELQAHPVRVAPCRIDTQPVNWRRFLAFVDDGGYGRPEFWDDRGCAWLATQAPLWRKTDGRWQQRRGPRWVSVDDDHAAIHLSAFEAEAWCRWAGRRLPTEAEWECAAMCDSRFLWGGAWEWTSSTFDPYPGFTPHPYRDYSAPWFGSRRALRGAAAATSPWLAHARYRNFFEPHRRDVFAGFRSAAQ